MLIYRSLIGILTLLLVSILVFAATQTLPGNAASAVLLNTATPQRLHALEVQLGLNKPAVQQYWTWLTGILHGNFGKSLANGTSVGTLIGGRILNSLVLVVLAGAIGTLIGVGLGVLAAARRDSVFDHVLSVTALAVTALPEFVVAVVLIIFFAAVVWHLFPCGFGVRAGHRAVVEPERARAPGGDAGHRGRAVRVPDDAGVDDRRA